MKLFIAVLKKFGFQPVTIFVQAFHYYEERASLDLINALFSSCCERNSKGVFLVRVPQGVENYCAELLLGKCQPIKEGDEQKDFIPPPPPRKPRRNRPRRDMGKGKKP